MIARSDEVLRRSAFRIARISAFHGGNEVVYQLVVIVARELQGERIIVAVLPVFVGVVVGRADDDERRERAALNGVVDDVFEGGRRGGRAEVCRFVAPTAVHHVYDVVAFRLRVSVGKIDDGALLKRLRPFLVGKRFVCIVKQFDERPLFVCRRVILGRYFSKFLRNLRRTAVRCSARSASARWRFIPPRRAAFSFKNDLHAFVIQIPKRTFLHGAPIALRSRIENGGKRRIRRNVVAYLRHGRGNMQLGYGRRTAERPGSDTLHAFGYFAALPCAG